MLYVSSALTAKHYTPFQIFLKFFGRSLFQAARFWAYSPIRKTQEKSTPYFGVLSLWSEIMRRKVVWLKPSLLPFDYRPFSSAFRFMKTIYIYREMSVAWFGAERVGNTPMPLYRPYAFLLFFYFQVVQACSVGVSYPTAALDPLGFCFPGSVPHSYRKCWGSLPPCFGLQLFGLNAIVWVVSFLLYILFISFNHTVKSENRTSQLNYRKKRRRFFSYCLC